MILTRQAIINQLCHELLEWKALNLRPEAILGTLNPQQNCRLYKELLSRAPLINTVNVLQKLEEYVFIRNVENDFLRHFGVYDPGAINPDLPQNPYFCATSLFREAMASNSIADQYDEDAQTALIDSERNFAYPYVAHHLNGVEIAARTGNAEMVSFLLRPSFAMFNLAHEYQVLLDNPLVAYPLVRQAIFHACGERFVPEMMDGLIQRVKTVDEWIALYDALGIVHRQQFMARCDSAIWTRLNPNEDQIKVILSKIPQQASQSFHMILLSIIDHITDGPLVLRLMERMTQRDRRNFVIKLGERVNNMFAEPIDLKSCLMLLGYSIDTNNSLKLDHLHLPDNALLPVVHGLNQQIWDSALSIEMKLRYFHVTRQLLLASPTERRACIEAYEACIDQCEGLLRDQADAGLNWFWRFWNAVGRLFGFIADFTVTIQARSLLAGVKHAVAVNPQFHGVIHDLSSVIMPLQPPESEQRKVAIAALTASPRRYNEFWETMTPEERAALFTDQARFQKLLQIFSNDESIDVSIQDLMRGLSQDMYNELLDVTNPEPLVSLFQMPRLSMETLLRCMGDLSKYELLKKPEWFGVMMCRLPEPIIQKWHILMDQAKLDETQNSFRHFQSVLVKAELSRFAFLGKYFNPSIPLKYSPEEIGGLIEVMPIEKLLPFWKIFMLGRAFTVAEMAKLLPVVTDVHKRQELITHQMTSSPITEWTDDLFTLLTDMTPEQQAYILSESVIRDDDLRRLNREGKIDFMISKLTPGNDAVLLDRYRTVFSQPFDLNNFLNQLSSACLALLLRKPPYEFLRILEQQTLLGLIKALRVRTDAQWEVVLPKLLDMATYTYGRGDPVVALLQKDHVPQETRYHLLTLLRTCTDEEISCLFDRFLNTDVVKALILHKKLDFKEITQEKIKEIIGSAVDAEGKPELISLSDKLFHELIRAQLEKLKNQVIDLVTLIGTTQTQTTLLALMVPKNGWTKFYYDNTVTIMNKWDAVVEEIKEMTKHHAELVRCSSIRHYDEVMMALKPTHEKILALVNQEVNPFINSQQVSINKTGLKLKNLTVNSNVGDVDAVVALKNVRDTLEQMDKDEEAKLLAAVPENDIIYKMKNGDNLKKFYNLIVMPENQASFLERCRELLVRDNYRLPSPACGRRVGDEGDFAIHPALTPSPSPTGGRGECVVMVRDSLWNEMSPSSVQLLSHQAPKALFARYIKDDFMSLVRAFHDLQPDQWDALAPNLLALREKYFGHEDKLVSLLRDNVPENAHLHVLALIKTTERDEDIEQLLQYFCSDVVSEYKKYHHVDDAMITIDALPSLMQTAEKWFFEEVRSKELAIQQQIGVLKTKISELKDALDVQKNQSWSFFSSSYTFDEPKINSFFPEISKILDEIKSELHYLDQLYLIQPDKSSDEFMNALSHDIKSKFLELRTFIDSENGKEKLKVAPWCNYRLNKKIHAEKCLNLICKELNQLAGTDGDLEMSVTLPGSAASFG